MHIIFHLKAFNYLRRTYTFLDNPVAKRGAVRFLNYTKRVWLTNEVKLVGYNFGIELNMK